MAKSKHQDDRVVRVELRTAGGGVPVLEFEDNATTEDREFGFRWMEAVRDRERIESLANVIGTADTMEDDSNTASSKYKDGRIGWRKLPVRAQETLLRWEFEGYSGISAMNQIDWHGGNHTIPIEKALLFRTQTTRNNPEGRSILRNSYTSYFALKNIKQIEQIGIERDLAGIPVATPPPSVDLFSPGHAQLLERTRSVSQVQGEAMADTFKRAFPPEGSFAEGGIVPPRPQGLEADIRRIVRDEIRAAGRRAARGL